MHTLFSKKHISGQDNFSYLLVSLLFLLLSSAAVEQFFGGSLFGQSLVITFTILSMIIGVWSLRSSRYAFNSTLGVIVSSAVISLSFILLDTAELTSIHLLLMLYFFVMTLRQAAQQAIFSAQVTYNSIIGSICIFLLLGLIWVVLYLLLIEFSSDAFTGVTLGSWQQNLPNLIYFSFVTLTTLGFGDLLPVSPLARFLVYIEAIVGVFYMAIVVSSLVSAGISHHQSEKK